MKAQEAVKWYTRVSFTYALSIWSLIGCYGYLRYTGRLDVTDTEKKEAPPVPPNPNEYVYESGRFKSIVIYKEGYGPHTSAISKFRDWINEKYADWRR